MLLPGYRITHRLQGLEYRRSNRGGGCRATGGVERGRSIGKKDERSTIASVRVGTIPRSTADSDSSINIDVSSLWLSLSFVVVVVVAEVEVATAAALFLVVAAVTVPKDIESVIIEWTTSRVSSVTRAVDCSVFVAVVRELDWELEVEWCCCLLLGFVLPRVV